MSPITIWRGWTAPTLEGELARRREAVLLNVLSSIVGLSLVLQLIQWSSVATGRARQVLPSLLLNIGVAAAFYGLLRLARAGRHRLSAGVLLVILEALAVEVLVGSGVMEPMWPLVLAMTVLLAAILLGLRATLLVLGVALVVVPPVVGLQDAGTLRPWDVTGPNLPDALGIIVVLGFMALVCWIYTRDFLTGIDEVLTGSAPTSPLRQLRTKSLSVREIEVVQLVAAGLSNDAIAGRLFISPRTVHSHVGNAMKKSGCANRTELGVLALREGLVPLQEEVPRVPSVAPDKAEAQRGKGNEPGVAEGGA